MAKGKNPHGKKGISKRVRRLNKEIAEQRNAVVNGLVAELERELSKRLNGGAL